MLDNLSLKSYNPDRKIAKSIVVAAFFLVPDRQGGGINIKGDANP